MNDVRKDQVSHDDLLPAGEVNSLRANVARRLARAHTQKKDPNKRLKDWRLHPTHTPLIIHLPYSCSFLLSHYTILQGKQSF